MDELSDKIALCLDIKKSFYILKEAELKRRGISWTKFVELENLTKRNFPRLADNPVVVDLGDGYEAEAVVKDIMLRQGVDKSIGKEVSHIKIHKQNKEK